MVDERALINLVKEHEELYNRNNQDYPNQALREKIWREVASKVCKSAAASLDCKERWNRVRENFRKALILRKQKMESGAKFKPPKYYDQLSFLIPYLTDDIPANIDDRDTCNDGDDQSDSSISNSTPPKTMKRSYSMTELTPHEATGRTEEVMVFGPTHSDNRTEEILTEFFVNMAKTVAKFPTKKQLDIKQKLFNMVHAVEVEMANEGNYFG